MSKRVTALFCLCLVWCGIHAQQAGEQIRYEVASVRAVDPAHPGSFDYTSLTAPHILFTPVPLTFLVQLAYDVESFQFRKFPAWADTRRFRVTASTGEQKITTEQGKIMLQNLLRDRFALRVHREKAVVQGYELIPAKGGIKLKTVDDPITLQGFFADGTIQSGVATADSFASALKGILNAPVEDHTGFTGKAVFNLKFAPLSDPNSTLPSLFTALEEQFGLKLQKKQIQMETLVFESANENPVED